jgi:hypothetical protein
MACSDLRGMEIVPATTTPTDDDRQRRDSHANEAGSNNQLGPLSRSPMAPTFYAAMRKSIVQSECSEIVIRHQTVHEAEMMKGDRYGSG